MDTIEEGSIYITPLPAVEVFLPSLLPGKAAVAIRYGAEPNTLYLIEEWLFLNPLQGAQIAASIALGYITFEKLKAKKAVCLAIPKVIEGGQGERINGN